MYKKCYACVYEKTPSFIDPCMVCYRTSRHVFFKPKQDNNVEKNCSKCDNSRKRHWNEGKCKVLSNCDSNNSGWKLRRDYNQENKEQEMKQYKQTKICTPRNILAKLEINPCNEAKSHFTDYIMFLVELFPNRSIIDISMDENVGPKSIEWILKSERRREYFIRFGFIEEEISLKPCPFCGKNNMTVYQEENGYWSIECCYSKITHSTTNELYKAWNTRK